MDDSTTLPKRKAKDKVDKNSHQVLKEEKEGLLVPSYAAQTVASKVKKATSVRGRPKQRVDTDDESHTSAHAPVARLYSERESTLAELAQEADDVSSKSSTSKGKKQSKKRKQPQKKRKTSILSTESDNSGTSDIDDHGAEQPAKQKTASKEPAYFTDEYSSGEDEVILSEDELDIEGITEDHTSRKGRAATISRTKLSLQERLEHKRSAYKGYRNKNLSILQKFEALIQNVKAGRQGDFAEVTRSLEDLLQEGRNLPRSQRRWDVELRPKGTTVAGFTYPARHPRFTGLGSSRNWALDVIPLTSSTDSDDRDPINFFVPNPREHFSGPNMRDPQTQLNFVETLLALVNVWQFGTISSQILRQTLVEVALRCGPGVVLALPGAYWDNVGWIQRLYYLNDKDGQVASILVSSYSGYSFFTRPIIDPTTEFQAIQLVGKRRKPVSGVTVPKTTEGTVTTWEAPLPSSEELDTFYQKRANPDQRRPTTQELLDRYHLYLFLAVTTRGSITTESRLVNACRRLEYLTGEVPEGSRKHGGIAKKHMPGIRGFGRLRQNRTRFTADFELTSFARTSLGRKGRFLCIVPTLDGRRLRPAFEATAAVLANGGHVVDGLECFLDGLAKMIRQVQNGVPPPPRELLAGPVAVQTPGSCDKCLRLTNHANLQHGLYGRLVCATCAPLETIEYHHHDAKLSVKFYMTNLIRVDLVGIDMADDTSLASRLIEEGTNAILVQQAGCDLSVEFKNGYTNTVNVREYSYSARNASIEKWFPIWRHPVTGLMVPHSADNLCLTYRFWNQATGRLLPGAKFLIADYARGDIGVDTLIQKLMPLHVVSLGIPARRDLCISTISERHFDALLFQMKTGIILDPTSLNDQQRNPHRIIRTVRNAPMDSRWTPDRKATINKIARQTDERYNREVSKIDWGRDGSPWPLQWGPRPCEPDNEPWTWTTLENFMVLRLNIMESACNWRSPTEDTTFTLWLELLFQLNSPDYVGLLNLPIRPWVNFPLDISIGHDIHGDQMLSGYTDDAKSLDDRVAARCNIRIETVLENRLRYDHSDEDVAKMPEMVRQVQTDARFYNPKLVAPPHLRGIKVPPVAKSSAYGNVKSHTSDDQADDEDDETFEIDLTGDDNDFEDEDLKRLVQQTQVKGTESAPGKRIQEIEDVVMTEESSKQVSLSTKSKSGTASSRLSSKRPPETSQRLPAPKGIARRKTQSTLQFGSAIASPRLVEVGKTADSPVTAEQVEDTLPIERDDMWDILPNVNYTQYDWETGLSMLASAYNEYINRTMPGKTIRDEEAYLKQPNCDDLFLLKWKDVLTLQVGPHSWLWDEGVQSLIIQWLPRDMQNNHVLPAAGDLNYYLGNAHIDLSDEQIINHLDTQIKENQLAASKPDQSPPHVFCHDMPDHTTRVSLVDNMNRNHWRHLCITKQPDTTATYVEIYDSIQNDRATLNVDIFSRLIKLMTFRSSGHWRHAVFNGARPMAAPQQHNSDDCGAYTVASIIDGLAGRESVRYPDGQGRRDHGEDLRWQFAQHNAGFFGIQLPRPKNPRTTYAIQLQLHGPDQSLTPILESKDVEAWVQRAEEIEAKRREKAARKRAEEEKKQIQAANAVTVANTTTLASMDTAIITEAALIMHADNGAEYQLPEIAAANRRHQYDWPEAMRITRAAFDIYLGHVNGTLPTESRYFAKEGVSTHNIGVDLQLPGLYHEGFLCFNEIVAFQPDRENDKSWLGDQAIMILMHMVLETVILQENVVANAAASLTKLAMGDAELPEHIEVALGKKIASNIAATRAGLDPPHVFLLDIPHGTEEVHTPFIHRGNHFEHISIVKKKGSPLITVLVYDSLRKSRPDKLLQMLAQLIATSRQDHWKEATTFEVLWGESSLQGNLNDCGIYTWCSMRDQLTGRKIIVHERKQDQADHGEDLRYEGLQYLVGRLGIVLPRPQDARTPYAKGLLQHGPNPTLIKNADYEQAVIKLRREAIDIAEKAKIEAYITPHTGLAKTAETKAVPTNISVPAKDLKEATPKHKPVPSITWDTPGSSDIAEDDLPSSYGAKDVSDRDLFALIKDVDTPKADVSPQNSSAKLTHPPRTPDRQEKTSWKPAGRISPHKMGDVPLLSPTKIVDRSRPGSSAGASPKTPSRLREAKSSPQLRGLAQLSPTHKPRTLERHDPLAEAPSLVSPRRVERPERSLSPPTKHGGAIRRSKATTSVRTTLEGLFEPIELSSSPVKPPTSVRKPRLTIEVPQGPVRSKAPSSPAKSPVKPSINAAISKAPAGTRKAPTAARAVQQPESAIIGSARSEDIAIAKLAAPETHLPPNNHAVAFHQELWKLWHAVMDQHVTATSEEDMDRIMANLSRIRSLIAESKGCTVTFDGKDTYTYTKDVNLHDLQEQVLPRRPGKE